MNGEEEDKNVEVAVGRVTSLRRSRPILDVQRSSTRPNRWSPILHRRLTPPLTETDFDDMLAALGDAGAATDYDDDDDDEMSITRQDRELNEISYGHSGADSARTANYYTTAGGGRGLQADVADHEEQTNLWQQWIGISDTSI